MNQEVPVSLRQPSGNTLLDGDVLVVCRDVVRACRVLIGNTLPLGGKPFVIQQSRDGLPRAHLDALPGEYAVSVTCLHTRDYARLAFQLGHELGHFWVDPRRTNWFIESTCTAVSYVCLDCLTWAWNADPPFPNWRGYAREFARYRKKHVRDAASKVGLSGIGEIARWVREGLRLVLAGDGFDREHEALCSLVISRCLRAAPLGCSALTLLGEVTQSGGETDFSAWLEKTSTSEQADLVGVLARLFAPAQGGDK